MDGHFEQVRLVNPRELKQIPGRESDVNDAQWIAELFQHGLLPAGLAPPQPVRELRDLTHHRAQLLVEREKLFHRIHETLVDANVKLEGRTDGSTAISMREVLKALAAAEQVMTRMAGRGRNSMRKKIQGRKETLEGGMNEHHRFMLKNMHSYLQSLDQQVSTFDVRIDAVLRACLTTDPGAAS